MTDDKFVVATISLKHVTYFLRLKYCFCGPQWFCEKKAINAKHCLLHPIDALDYSK